MNIKSQKDFFSGLMFMGVGMAFAWGASTYTIGNGARMGPGYFPLMLGIVMALIGLGIMFSGLSVETEDGEPIGKPGTHEAARAQLRRMRGRTVVFHTALAVVQSANGFEAADLAAVRVVFRDLSDAEIEHYLRTEHPYDCAGSAKCETLGIALLDAIESDDPTALVGLPLIRTSALLRAAGIDPLTAAP